MPFFIINPKQSLLGQSLNARSDIVHFAVRVGTIGFETPPDYIGFASHVWLWFIAEETGDVKARKHIIFLFG
jgi:hypothetical protein